MRISDWSSDVCSSDLWHMRSNVAVYHQWYDDIQRTVAASNPDGTPGSAVQNAAKAKVFGLELEQTIAPTQHLSLQLNYAYVLPEYDSWRSEEHTSELQSLMRISYAVFCLKKKNKLYTTTKKVDKHAYMYNYICHTRIFKTTTYNED